MLHMCLGLRLCLFMHKEGEPKKQSFPVQLGWEAGKRGLWCFRAGGLGSRGCPSVGTRRDGSTGGRGS